MKPPLLAHLHAHPFHTDGDQIQLNYRPAVKELKRVKTRHEELLNSKEHMAEAMTNGTISSTAQHHAFDPQLPSTSTANIDDDDTDALMEEHRQETLDREIKEAEAAVERAMVDVEKLDNCDPLMTHRFSAATLLHN